MIAALLLSIMLATNPAPQIHRNYELTPGAIAPGVTAAQVCVAGYATSVRPSLAESTKLKSQAMAEYAIAKAPRSAYQLDHVVPLELGGAPRDLHNLWPEPIIAAHVKDKVENAMHRAVCDGRVSLPKAQACMAFNYTLCVKWYLKAPSLPSTR